MTKRNVYWLDETMVDPRSGQYVPAIVTEGEAGYSPTTFLWGSDFAQAKKWTDEANTAMGIDRRTASDIVLSSMRASNAEVPLAATTVVLSPERRADLNDLLIAAGKAAYGDSNDEELEALNEALDLALRILDVQRPEVNDPETED